MISRTLQKVRKGMVKRQRLVADPPSLANHLATFSTILLSQNPFQLHDAMIIPQCDIPYHILRTNRNATFFNIPMSPPDAVCTSRKSSSSGCTKPRKPCQTNQRECSWWAFSSPLSPFFRFFLFYITMHLLLQVHGYQILHAPLTNDLSFDTGMVSDTVKRDVMLEIESVLDREVDQAWNIGLQRRLWWGCENAKKAADGRAERGERLNCSSGKIDFS